MGCSVAVVVVSSTGKETVKRAVVFAQQLRLFVVLKIMWGKKQGLAERF